MYPLDNRVKEYAWGSRTAIAELLGRVTPSPRPEAELWLGAHPAAPSRVERDGGWASLADVITASPETELGPSVVARFGPRLPFLFKVLAAETPLSLQAHPNTEQARAGFDAEERAHVPLDAPHRNYKDRSHKPELIYALGPFELLCGFRSATETARLFEALEIPSLATSLGELERRPGPASLRAFSSRLLGLDDGARSDLVSATVAACRRHVETNGEFAIECGWAVRIGAMYPGDIGVVIALMLNLVTLDAGQAIYLPVGNLHAYLRGVGLEIMANSDNVIRGGLTPKHVDVPELLRVLTFSDGPVNLVAKKSNGPEEVCDTPASEFRLSRIALRDGRGFRVSERRGPEILLCTEGRIDVTSPHEVPRVLSKGASLFVPASNGSYSLGGSGDLFRATVGAL